MSKFIVCTCCVLCVKRFVSLFKHVEGSGHGLFLIYSLSPANVQRDREIINNLKSGKPITGKDFKP